MNNNELENVLGVPVGTIKKDELQGFKKVLEEILEIKLKKREDYKGSWRVFGLMGILYQIGGKFIRLWNLRHKDPMNEPLRDSYRDIAVYAIMAIQLIDEKDTVEKITNICS